MNTTYKPRNHFDSAVVKLERFRRRTELRCAFLARVTGKGKRHQPQETAKELPRKG